MMLIFLSIVVVILTSAAQILWKFGVGPEIKNLESLMRIIISPFIISAAGFYIVAVLIWTFLISKYQFHIIYPLLSLSFIFTLVAARLVFREEISLISWIGAGVILLGIIIIGFGFK